MKRQHEILFVKAEQAIHQRLGKPWLVGINRNKTAHKGIDTTIKRLW